MEKQRTKEVAIKCMLYTYYAGPDGTHPVRLKVTANRASRFYPVQYEGKNLFLTPKDWEKIIAEKPKGDNRKMKENISNVEKFARDARDKVLENGRSFDFTNFEREFKHQDSKKGLLARWEDYLNEIKAAERAGTYIAYKNALQAFKYFRGMILEKEKDEAGKPVKDKAGKTVTVIKEPAKEINPENLTVQVLKDFEKFLKDRGCGDTTVGMYQRSLKVIFNLAATDKPSLMEAYPFALKQNDNKRYVIRTGSGSKGETLSLEQLQALISTATTPGTPEHEAKLLWLFSFYGQGMNFKDIALLKYKDIKDDLIRYVRHKTKRTERKPSEMEIPFTPQMKEIVVEIGNPDKSSNAYLFNIIRKGDNDAIKIDSVIRQKIKITNKWLKRLCQDKELAEITTYAARHSYANLLKQLNEPTEMIRELLGHSDMRTTEAYLKRFDTSKTKQVSEKVTAILKPSKLAS